MVNIHSVFLQRPSDVIREIRSIVPPHLQNPWTYWIIDSFGLAVDALWALAQGMVLSGPEVNNIIWYHEIMDVCVLKNEILLHRFNL